ncbi:MAG: glycosyltransferase family 2 protein [Bacilli bacterium]|nr:glycosyltransferase family 2 protein [Bacilli bacterium]
MKFSIIIPIYNAEKYIEKCLNSVFNQTYNNYELILINDGSKDNSESIIKKIIKKNKNILFFSQENKGQSVARNVGLEHATGDYIIFLDSDDYLDLNLLEVLNEHLKNNSNIDVLRFQSNIVDENGNIINKIKFHEFDNVSGEESFNYFVEEDMFDTPCFYTYKRSFWKENKFKFSEGKVHEDFGLIPRVILLSNKVSSVSFFGYNYVQNPNSTTHIYDRNKVLKRVYDLLYHYDELYKFIIDNKTISKNTKKLFISFLANSIISKSKELENSDLNKYIKELKLRKVSNKLLSNSIPRILKKILITINLKFYINKFVRNGC